MYKHALAALGLGLFSTVAAARGATWEVTVTNTTAAQTFTPLLAVAHDSSWDMFELGAPASEALAAMAEGGDTSGLSAEAHGAATAMAGNGALLAPGESATLLLQGPPGRVRLSLAGMLIPTNDTFIALDGVSLPSAGTDTHWVPAYDAGSEINDQSCQHIPGPRCGGEGYSVEPGEGHVHVSSGFHDLGTVDPEGFEVLSPAAYDWRNPAAMITVKRVR